jgi:hypothetical protein
MAFADESETVIEQEQRQENVEVLNHLMTTVVRTWLIVQLSLHVQPSEQAESQSLANLKK